MLGVFAMALHVHVADPDVISVLARSILSDVLIFRRNGYMGLLALYPPYRITTAR